MIPGRFTIRYLMAAVAVAGGVLGWRQHRVYQELSYHYRFQANSYARREADARRWAGLTPAEWLAECREGDRLNQEGPFEVSGGIRVMLTWPEPPEVQRRQADEWARLKAKYERAARRPWLPVEPEEEWSW